MRWASRGTRVTEINDYVHPILGGNLRRRNVYGRIILKWMLGKYAVRNGRVSTGSMSEFLIIIMNLRFIYKAGILLDGLSKRRVFKQFPVPWSYWL
jgi:hypothetical protein